MNCVRYSGRRRRRNLDDIHSVQVGLASLGPRILHLLLHTSGLA